MLLCGAGLGVSQQTILAFLWTFVVIKYGFPLFVSRVFTLWLIPVNHSQPAKTILVSIRELEDKLPILPGVHLAITRRIINAWSGENCVKEINCEHGHSRLPYGGTPPSRIFNLGVIHLADRQSLTGGRGRKGRGGNREREPHDSRVLWEKVSPLTEFHRRAFRRSGSFSHSFRFKLKVSCVRSFSPPLAWARGKSD